MMAIRSRVLRAALTAALCLPTVALAVPATVPVQGVLADAEGQPVADTLPVIFNLYADAAGETLVWTEERQVDFDRGFFTLDLGTVEPIDAGLFRDHPAGLWLGIAVDGDDEMDPVALGTSPFAGLAAYADDAATIGGQGPEAFAAADHTHAFGDLTDLPGGLADGDDDTTYAAGDGLVLADGAFALRGDCGPGQVLAFEEGGWNCAEQSDPATGVITSVELAGTELIINEGGRVTTVDLVALAADGDADAANELLIGAALEGAELVLTDAGGEQRVDLSSLAPAVQTVSGVSLDGTVLTLARGDDPAAAFTVDLAPLVPVDGDSDPTNELLQGAALNASILELTDAGGVLSVDLAPLFAGLDVNDADADPANELLGGALLNGTTLELSDAGGTTAVDLGPLVAGLDVDDADADPANELLAGALLNGTTLELSDAGGTTAVDLVALVDDADADPANELLIGALLDGTTLELNDAGGTTSVELGALVDDADADPANELLAGALLNGTDLELTDGGGTTSVELGSLVNDADADPANELITGALLNGTTLQVTEAGSTTSVELGSLVDDADADPTNEIQQLTVNAAGDVSITGANSVNVYQGAFIVSSNLGISQDDIAFADAINGDDQTQSVQMPFSVSYGGVDYDTVCVTTNGWFEFGGLCNFADFGNEALPTDEHPGPFVAAYWDDLRGTVSWSTEGDAPNRVFTIYSDTETLGGSHNMDFTVQVHEGSGTITVRYLANAVDASGQSATIGFQAAGGRNAKAYPLGHNARVIDDNSDDNGPSDQGWSVTPLR